VSRMRETDGLSIARCVPIDNAPATSIAGSRTVEPAGEAVRQGGHLDSYAGRVGTS